jgi:hypothetical protein
MTAAIESAKPLRTWAVNPMVRRAAVATAACLLLGTAGYFGSAAMDDGKLPLWVQDSAPKPKYTSKGYLSHETQTDRVLRKNDLVNVTVNDLVAPNVETTKTNRISENGTISLPLVGSLRAEGLTEAELEKSIADAYRNAKVIDKAQVSVTTNESTGRQSGLVDNSESMKLGVPDFSDAPSFNLSSTYEASRAGGGGSGGELFGGSDGGGVGKEWYTGGYRINAPPANQPYKPGDKAPLITGGTVVSGVVTSGREFRGKEGDAVVYTDGHADFKNTAQAGQQDGDIYQFDAGAGVNSSGGIVRGGTLTLGGQTLKEEPKDATRARRGEAIYNFSKQLNDANEARARGDVTAAAEATKAARAIREAGKGDFTAAELESMEKRVADVQRGDQAARVIAQANAGAPAATQPTAVVTESRKIIRSGEVVFEIHHFDSAAGTISKIVGENGGVVSTINSDKLPNGKVRGQMIVRVPPDRLDTFVLQLRGLGELKSQRLGSSDVTKEYYDLASDLRAARAMEERLLAIIKNGAGAIKDLLEAEKELANWRGKIEKIIGQQKYYDNLVSLATLTVTLYERDIATAAATTERETINSGIEADDVEKARTQALEILGEAKARIISSDLKKLDAGQVASTVVADIPPDNAAAVVDRIKQLGKVARLEVQRAMSADANAPTAATSKVERKDARLTLSLYNVANVQPRVSTSVELASTDVPATYNALAARVVKAGGRVVRGGASLQRGNTAAADGQFEVPADAGEAFLNDLKAMGDVVSMSTAESPDAANVTTSKRGFTVQISPAANLPPRQSANLRVETRDVDTASANLQATLLAAGGRVLDASTATDPAGQSIARVQLEVPLAKAGELVTAAKNLGEVRAISSTQNAAAPGGPLAKARLEVVFATPGPLVSQESGLMANIRDGLSTSARGLLFGVKMIVIGLCFVLPWVIVLWVGAKLFRRKKTAVPAP